jgi:hypothetical protein
MRNVKCIYVVAVVIAVVVGGARFALGQESEAIEAEQAKVVKRQAASDAPLLPGLPVESNSAPYEGVYIPAPPDQARIPKVHPLESLQQTADSPVIKAKLREFISMEVPVMYQTMMMVENGAATGFIGALNALNALENSFVQSARFKLDLIDAAASANPEKKGFVDALWYEQNKQGSGQGTRPSNGSVPANGSSAPVYSHSLLTVLGENTQATPAPFDKAVSAADPDGSSAVDVGKTSASSQTTTTPSSPNGDVSLAEKIFMLVNGEQGITQDELNRFKTELRDWVGDIKRQKPTNSPMELTIVAPNGMQNNDQEEEYIYPVRIHEFKKEVWVALNKVVKSYCEFKKNNSVNASRHIFEKVRPSDSIAEEEWVKVQSLDIKFTTNILDQYFNILLYRRPIEEINCDVFNESDLPSIDQLKSSGSSSFDKCEPSQNNSQSPLCLPKRILFRIADFIARSKTDYFYRDLWYVSAVRASKEASHVADLNYLYCTNLRLAINGQFDQSMVCDPEDAFQTRIEQNRQDWISFINEFSQLAQGRSGSSPFRPLSSSIQGSN